MTIAIISIVVFPVLIGWLFSRHQKPCSTWKLPGFGVYRPGMPPACRPASSEY